MPKSEPLRDPIAQQMQRVARRSWANSAGVLVALALLIAVVSGLVVPNNQRSRAADRKSTQALRLLKGDTGPKGRTGNVGPTGAPGPAGAPGPTGKAGIQGLPGPAGLRGNRGDTGLIGENGKPGEHGARGEKGEKGNPGDPGTGGPAGPQGPPGPQGPQGPVGPAPDLVGQVLQCEPNPDPALPGTYVCKFVPQP